MLYWLSGLLPYRLISVRDQPYIERYYVGMLFGITFYLHRFIRDDSEPHLHNHPWVKGFSFILWGSYTEERVTDLDPLQPQGALTKQCNCRWFNVVNGATFHRIISVKRGTWSLMCHGERHPTKGWGFLSSESRMRALDDPASVDGLFCNTTVFTPAKVGELGWFKTAPLGRVVDRADP